MAVDKLIDSTIENACRTAEANAIRAKTGSTAQITYDWANSKGFADAINTIPMGVAKPKWVQTTLPTSANWQSVCYGNGKFVAVSFSNVAAYSNDDITWTRTTLPDNTSWDSVCYGDGKFVTVDQTSAISAYLKDYFDEWA